MRAVIVATVAVIAVVTLRVPAAQISCAPPPYVVGPFNIRGESLRAVAVAIAPQDFTREKLRCLARVLKEKYSHPTALAFTIFDSKSALAHYAGRPAGPDARSLAIISHVHAIYFRYPREEYLEIKPVGTDDTGALDSRIDLASNQPTDCKAAIRDRCLMLVGQLGSHVASGATPKEVQLHAQIARDGRVPRVQILNQDSQGSSRTFARWVAEQVRTWRFESGETIDVTVSATVSPETFAPVMAVQIGDPGTTIDIHVTYGRGVGRW
jgi:hypothetical protein